MVKIHIIISKIPTYDILDSPRIYASKSAFATLEWQIYHLQKTNGAIRLHIFFTRIWTTISNSTEHFINALYVELSVRKVENRDPGCFRLLSHKPLLGWRGDFLIEPTPILKERRSHQLASTLHHPISHPLLKAVTFTRLGYFISLVALVSTNRTTLHSFQYSISIPLILRVPAIEERIPRELVNKFVFGISSRVRSTIASSMVYWLSNRSEC